jgi:hypothetical protein
VDRQSDLSEESGHYESFLLRLTKSNADGRPVWRASLESTQTGEQRHFASLKQLVAFLKTRFREPPSHTFHPDRSVDSTNLRSEE